ncbi:condensation domain-containing protein [Marinactinospora rubrisoli]|uniref:Condensation domain-containing protein n=1 Tax=Marinactinospora rubrisoli TaxID=2715399 RepID=A0ABW2KGX3_9ACTN
MVRIVRRRIPFSGRAGEGPATWAQRQMWRLIQQRMPDSAFYDHSLGCELPGGLTLEDVLSQIARLVERHDSLRTLFRYEDGVLTQRVVGSGLLDVAVLLADGAEEPHSRDLFLAHQAEMCGTGFDLAAEPPFRPLVGLVDGTPRGLGFCVPHVAADLPASRIVIEELRTALTAVAAGEPPPVLPAARRPLDEAAFERSERGRALNEAALRHWRAQLARLPPTMFPGPGVAAADPRFQSGALESRAMRLALDTLAARYRVSVSAVALTAIAAVLGAYSGLPRCGLQLIVGNRFVPELRRAVLNAIQEVPVAVDLRAGTFQEVARATFRTALAAYRNARYDPDDADSLVAEAGRARGAAIELGCYFNDIRRPAEPGAVAAAATAEEVRAAVPASRFAATDPQEREAAYFVLMDTPDVLSGRSASVVLELCADTRHIPPPVIEEVLRGVERLLVAAVEREIGPEELPAATGVTPAGGGGPAQPARAGRLPVAEGGAA